MDEDRMRRVGHLQQLGGTRLVTLGDGAERGVRAVEFRTTAGLEFAVLVDRAMDIGWTRWRGRSVAWHSPRGFVAPAFKELESLDRLGWLRTWGGGLFTTAGLDHILFPQSDSHDTYNSSVTDHMDYGMHGRVSVEPARLLGYGEEWRDGTCYLFAEGEVTQATALFEHIVLRRRVETTLDGAEITWTDTVINNGHQPTPQMLLYHVNLGSPLVGERSELHLPSREVRWTTPTVPDRDGFHLEFTPPDPSFVEQAIEHDMAPSADGRVRLALINRDLEEQPWGVSFDYDKARFPYFFQWRVLAAGTYAIGFEPATNGVTTRDEAREAGELTILEPGESRTSSTTLGVVEGADACAAAIAATRIEAS